MPLPSPDRLQQLIHGLEDGLLEREAATRLALLAALAGEHVLLIGPPGTAKSELARRLHRAFSDAPYFERLLTRFSTPEELFGPLSLKALENDCYERLTEGFLPTAGIGFLDEIFKANSAILNTLLTLLNEREFDNGRGRFQVPLISVVAASNEVPVDEALKAFYDRFLLRVPIRPVSDESFAALLALEPCAAAAKLQPISPTERQAVFTQAHNVLISPAAVEACTALRTWLRQESLAVSDRRWRQWIGLMRTAAATEGRSEVDAVDLWTAPFVVSPEPEVAARIEHWFAAELMQCEEQELPWLTRAVEAFAKQLQIEENAVAEDSAEADAGKIALARAISGHAMPDAPGDGMLRIVSEQLEASRRRRYSTVHIEARLRQLDELLVQMQAAHTEISTAHLSLDSVLAKRLWMPPSLKQRLLDGHRRTLEHLSGLRDRLRRSRIGFGSLPVDTLQVLAEPAPVALPGLG
jgi:MoxR-like ATPase